VRIAVVVGHRVTRNERGAAGEDRGRDCSVWYVVLH